jgi:hypothetical protein
MLECRNAVGSLIRSVQGHINHAARSSRLRWNHAADGLEEWHNERDRFPMHFSPAIIPLGLPECVFSRSAV